MTSIIIAGAVVLGMITAIFILYPVFRASAVVRQRITDSVASDRLAELIAQRDAIYDAIRDADFDRETGKLTEEDHRLMRERLTAEGVRLLQELDRLMQSDVREDLEQEIEREVVALRQSRPVEAVEGRRGRRAVAPPAVRPQPVVADGKLTDCPACGGQVRVSARFCTHCGASLASTCPECGVLVKADDQFCSGCGAQLAKVEAAETIPADALD